MDMRQFDDDHRFLLDALEQAAPLLVAGGCDGEGVQTLAAQVAALDARLKLHLVIEDRFLYPQLLDSGEHHLRSRAAAMQNEMGRLYAEYRVFVDTFVARNGAEREPERFVAEARRLFGLLRRRIEREEAELYPLAGRL